MDAFLKKHEEALRQAFQLDGACALFDEGKEVAGASSIGATVASLSRSAYLSQGESDWPAKTAGACLARDVSFSRNGAPSRRCRVFPGRRSAGGS